MVISAVRSESPNLSSIGTLVEEVKRRQPIGTGDIHYMVRWHGNTVVHLLAHHAPILSTSSVWIQAAPDLIGGSLAQDLCDL